MLRKCENLEGMHFGRLSVISIDEQRSKRRTYWFCLCQCGNKVSVQSSDLKCGHTKSCGCIRRENSKMLLETHGKRRTRIYTIWCNMKARCSNPNNKSYKDYGGRGIFVCQEWIESFEAFYIWAMGANYNNKLTIDRINNGDGYYPNNCQWVTPIIQSNNTRRNHMLTYKEQTKTMAEWAHNLKMPYSTLKSRICLYGWSVEKAIETPVRKRKCRQRC